MADTENKLQIAKSILKKFVTGECVTDDEILEAFPDLGESDDEKTRKDIRKFVEAFAQWNDRRRFCDWLDKHKEHGSTEKQDYSGLTDFQRAIHRGFLCAGVENVPRTIIEETAKDCIAQIKPKEDQIARLYDAVESWRGCIGYGTLKSLYEDLLKLG